MLIDITPQQLEDEMPEAAEQAKEELFGFTFSKSDGTYIAQDEAGQIYHWDDFCGYWVVPGEDS